MKLSRSHPHVKDLLAKTFPDYSGRKVSLEAYERVQFLDNWDGGSRTSYVLVNLDSGVTMPLSGHGAPWTREQIEKSQTRNLPENALVAEYVIFCGKSLGVVFVVHPSRLEAMTRLLTEPVTKERGIVARAF